MHVPPSPQPPAATEVAHLSAGPVTYRRVGTGPAVVLCHGTPFSSRVWRHVSEALASRYTVYLWDMPGYGLSISQPRGHVTLPAQAETFAELVHAWGLDRPAVVAHDIGAAVALGAHLRHDVQMRALALVDAVALPGWGTDFFKLVASNSEVFEQLPPNYHRALLAEYVASSAYTELGEELEDLMTPWLSPTGQVAFYHQITQLHPQYTEELAQQYPTITTPTHVFWGENDEWIPISRGERLAETIPTAALTRIPDAGHLVQLDQPDRLAAALGEFLHKHNR